MNRLFVAVFGLLGLFLIAPAFADTAPTIISTGCGLSGGPIYSVGTILQFTNVNGSATGASNSFTSANCGSAQMRSNSGTAMTDSLPSPAIVGSQFFIYIANADSLANDTITPVSGTINGQPSIGIAPGQAAMIATDGSNYFVISGVTSGTAFNPASPGPIGGTTPSTGKFTALTVNSSLVATGLVTNADLTNSSITVNGTTCTLGSTCFPTASASTITPGTTTITSGTPSGLLYDNAGLLGNLGTTNSGVLITSAGGVPSISTTLPSGIAATNMTLTSPTLIAPALGVATATSINKIAITAPSTSATLTLANGSTLATAGAFTTTLTSTAATALTLPTSGTVTALGNTVTGSGGTLVEAASPTLITPTLGAATATSLTFGGGVMSVYTAPTAWTPAITVGGGATTASAATGYYMQIGKQVIAWFDIMLSSLNSQTGTVLITGIPSSLNCNGSINGNLSLNFFFNGSSSLTQPLSGYVNTNSTSIVIDKLVSGSSTQLTNSDLSATTRVAGVVTYFVP